MLIGKTVFVLSRLLGYNEVTMVRSREAVAAKMSKSALYEEVAESLASMISDGIYRPGDRIPSIRSMSRNKRLSVNTVMRAYVHLENMGLIEARPQSGYYVRCRILEPESAPVRIVKAEDIAPSPVTIRDVSFQIMTSLSDRSLVPLGRGVPNSELLPIDKLNRMLGTESRRFRIQSISYEDVAGSTRLRAQIARRSLNAGCALSLDDILVTSGCREAISLALYALCRPGDTVAVESPVYYSFLRIAEWLGLRVLEIPSSSDEGMNLDVLDYVIRHNTVRACAAILNFNNPLGSVMSEEKKCELVSMLAKHEIPLIEDDVYGDLSFGSDRPVSAKAFDNKGLVIVCSSFSKTLAPGYRVGWIVPGRYRQKIEQLKALFNGTTASPTQLAIAEFLTNGGYDHYLRTIRRIYSRNVAAMRDAVARYFPQGTRVTRPSGGFTLWVEMPEYVDAITLYKKALLKGISIAPGPIFTLGDRFRNCVRLNAAFWSEQTEQALETLGWIAREMV